MILGWKEAQSRTRKNLCMSCGTEEIGCVELSSCHNPKCVAELRKLHKQTKKIISHLGSKVQTTYSNSIKLGVKSVN